MVICFRMVAKIGDNSQNVKSVKNEVVFGDKYKFFEPGSRNAVRLLLRRTRVPWECYLAFI